MAQSPPDSSNVSNPNFTFLDLPDDLLALIVVTSLHDPRDVAALTCTNHRLQRICKKAPLRLSLRNFFSPSTLSNNAEVQRQLHVTLQALCNAFHGVAEVDLSWLPISNATIALLAKILPSLNSLQLSGCKKLTSAAVTALAANPSLHTIDLQRCFQLHSGALTELVAAASLHGSCLAHVALSHLDLSCWRRPASPLRAGAAALRVVSLHNCTHFTSGTLANLASACPVLEVLCLGGCASLLSDLPASLSLPAVAVNTEDAGPDYISEHKLSLMRLAPAAAAMATPRALAGGEYSIWLQGAAVELAVIVQQLPRLRVLELSFCPPGLAATLRQLLTHSSPSSSSFSMVDSHRQSQSQSPSQSSIEIWDLCDPLCVERARAWQSQETRAWWQEKERQRTALPPNIIQAFLRSAVRCSSPTRVTPLHFASEDGTLSHVDGLLALGAEVSARDKNGGSPLFVACEVGHAAAATRLLAAGADVTARNAAGEAPLYIAALRGHSGVVEVLLEHCAKEGIPWDDPRLYGDGWTPLMAAAVSGRVEIAAQLLSAAGPGAGALVRASNRYGQTCVHVAARKGTPALIQALLDAGGPTSAGMADIEGRTAADVAIYMGNMNALKMLARGAVSRMSHQKSRGTTPTVERPRVPLEKQQGQRWVGRRLSQRKAQST